MERYRLLTQNEHKYKAFKIYYACGVQVSSGIK